MTQLQKDFQKALLLGRANPNTAQCLVSEFNTLVQKYDDGFTTDRSKRIRLYYIKGQQQVQADAALGDENLKERARTFGSYEKAFKVAMKTRRHVYSDELPTSPTVV